MMNKRMNKRTLKFVSLLLAATISFSAFYFGGNTVSADSRAQNPLETELAAECFQNSSELRTAPANEVIPEGDMTSKLKFSGQTVKQLTEYEIYETEPNDTTESADTITNNFTAESWYYLNGTITDYSDDLDLFSFTLTTGGTFSSMAFWFGNYYDYYWEDDLAIAIFDENLNMVTTGYYDSIGAQFLDIHLAAGNYYFAVTANPNSSTYIGEPYLAAIAFQPDAAVIYNVSFNSQGGSAVSGMSAAAGTTIYAPAAPARTGYSFSGWYRDAACTNPWNFSTNKVTSDMTLFAKWTANTYTVSFNSQGGSAVGSRSASYNSILEAPAAPTRTGYTFEGWYRDAACTNPWNFSTNKVTSNMTLYAKWTANTYTVTFNSQGGSAASNVSASYNSLITAPEAPTREDGTFEGWYKESGCINPWDFGTDKVTSATTLYAKWTYTAISRLSGSDRYSTSVAISQSGWSQADTVIIATGANYPDALAASSLTKSKDAPILLTKKDALDQSVIDEIQRLNAGSAILIGGAGVIGTGVEDQLNGLGLSVTRISGTNRYETSAQVAGMIGTDNGIIIATGLNFPDALSIAPVAAMKSMPILLSPKASLDTYVSEFIAGKAIPASYVVGGSSVLDSSIAGSLPNSTVLSGTDRYATNLSIINEFSGDFSFDTVYLATGSNFPDALSGSAMAAKYNAPIILTGKDSISADAINLLKSKNVQHVVILGGSSVISQNVENAVAEAIRYNTVTP